MNRSAQILSYSEELRQRGKHASYRVISFSLQEAPTKICTRLDLHSETRVYYYERVLSSDDIPYCYEEGYMPYGFFPDLSATHLEHSRLDYVEKDKGIEIDYSHQIVQAILPDERMMHLLGLDERKPLIRNSHVTYDMSGKPIFSTVNIFDTDSYQANFIKKRHHSDPDT
jgi:DNA-binding GntR family transcriptional regulator